MPELHSLTILEARELLRTADLSAVSLCRAFLDRHAELDRKLGAFLHLDAESVLRAAEAADLRLRNGTAREFEGVPIAVKDNISVAGQPCTCASRILQGYTGAYDATVVQRLRDKGFIVLGRTNMDEFAMGSATTLGAFGQAANPWDLTKVAGGSSGGSAAAVASCQVPAALGSDTGGSVRQPASFCGVVGLKPTYGRVSRYGLVAYASSLDQIGPLAKNVRDAAAILGVIEGEDAYDSTSLPLSSEHLLSSLDNVDLRGLKIGLPKEYLEVEGLADEVRKTFGQTVAMLRELGAETVDISLPHSDSAVAVYYIIATAEASANLARFEGIRYGARIKDPGDIIELYRQTRAAGFGDEVKRRIILGTYVLSSGYYDAYYLRAQKVRTLIRDDFRQAFNACDLILAPVYPTPAYGRDEKHSPLQEYLADIYTVPANLAGVCGISIPCGMTHAGLPVGLQLLGRPLGEAGLLRAAEAVYQNSPCRGRAPAGL